MPIERRMRGTFCLQMHLWVSSVALARNESRSPDLLYRVEAEYLDSLLESARLACQNNNLPRQAFVSVVDWLYAEEQKL
jgi:hypothetical protein